MFGFVFLNQEIFSSVQSLVIFIKKKLFSETEIILNSHQIPIPGYI